MGAQQRKRRPLLDQFAEVIGEDAAVKISAHFGGRQLYVPRKPPSTTSPLVEAIGEIAAHKLAKRFGGLSYAIPLTAGKRARIEQLLGEGATVREVADELGCTERYVYKVQAELHEGDASRPRRKRRKRQRRPPPPSKREARRAAEARARAAQGDLFRGWTGGPAANSRKGG